MAILGVKAEKSAGLRRCTLVVDGHPVPLNSDGEGAILVRGECGDESRHVLGYTLVGDAGEGASITIYCGDRKVFELEDITILEEEEPYAADLQGFTL